MIVMCLQAHNFTRQLWLYEVFSSSNGQFWWATKFSTLHVRKSSKPVIHILGKGLAQCSISFPHILICQILTLYPMIIQPWKKKWFFVFIYWDMLGWPWPKNKLQVLGRSSWKNIFMLLKIGLGHAPTGATHTKVILLSPTTNVNNSNFFFFMSMLIIAS